MRVATETTPGHFIGAGVYVDGGSRYESARIRGATHLTDRMAFKVRPESLHLCDVAGVESGRTQQSTRNRTAEQMSLEIEQLGSSFTSTSGRDTIMYQATSYPQSLPSVVSVLADTVLNPLLLPEELEAEKLGAGWEVSDMKKKPEYMLPELLHEVAFKDNTVGLPLVCPEDRLPLLTPEVLWEYRQLWFRPERLVVAGVGMTHEALLEQVDRHFGSYRTLPTRPSIPNSYYTSSSSSSTSRPFLSKNYATAASPPVDMHTGQPLQSFEELVSAKPLYTGGQLLIEEGEDKHAHVYVGFETSGVHDPDLYALACIHVMMGGGSSFSAGGPGKGMYSRLYTGVLNQHYDVDYCQAFHHCYQDTGLFGMAISVTPEFVGRVPQIVAAQLDSVTRQVRGGIGENELRRAKNQLKSSLMFGLESRQLQVEDLGRQVQMSGSKTSPQECVALL